MHKFTQHVVFRPLDIGMDFTVGSTDPCFWRGTVLRVNPNPSGNYIPLVTWTAPGGSTETKPGSFGYTAYGEGVYKASFLPIIDGDTVNCPVEDSIDLRSNYEPDIYAPEGVRYCRDSELILVAEPIPDIDTNEVSFSWSGLGTGTSDTTAVIDSGWYYLEVTTPYCTFNDEYYVKPCNKLDVFAPCGLNICNVNNLELVIRPKTGQSITNIEWINPQGMAVSYTHLTLPTTSRV